MAKKLTVILFLALFMISAVAIARDAEVRSSNVSKYRQVRYNLFDTGDNPGQFAMNSKAIFPSTALAFAPTRQLYGNATTIRDFQHNTATGRQISYGGYYNAACDFVYMDFADITFIGSTEIRNVKLAIFDWLVGDWDTGSGGQVAAAGITPSYYPQMSVTPDDGFGVIAYHSTAGLAGGNVWSYAAFAGSCPVYTYVEDSLPGPPNTGNVQTGLCGDVDAATTPYIWPKLDVDTTSTGAVVTHIASNENGACEVPESAIETSSLVYYRKVETTDGEPWTGTWEGPVFMDSAYLISNIVRADRNSSDVYYIYLKPSYYQNGPLNPCDANGVGHYQLTSEVAYRKSTDDGQTWGPVTLVTDYASGFADNNTEPAVYDISGMVDPNGNLHLVWVSNNRDPEDACNLFFASKMWHWDSDNDCISVAYDASHPSLFVGSPGTFNNVATKPNISWCDGNLYISFTRFGGNPDGDTSNDFGAGVSGQEELYQNGEVFVVASDASGDMGKTWTDAINLTQTPSESCLVGDCFSETWTTMAMYSNDSLMLQYIEDKDPGAHFYSAEEGSETTNPVMFMTWPCFSMGDVGSNVCLSVTPNDPTYPEIALAPNGSTGGCTTPASFTGTVELNNCGNVSLNASLSSDAAWLTANVTPVSGDISAGVGPRYSDNVAWTGAPGCAAPTVVEWTASSASLGQGNYSGSITVDIDNALADDFDISVNLVVACDYYEAEFASVSSGCWTIDLWNTPQAAGGSDNDNLGNMTFYACGDDSTLAPLYTEALIVGWTDGSDILCFTDNSDDHMGDLLPAGLPSWQRQNARMRALSGITVTPVGSPSSGSGYWATEGFWCTPDSSVFGKTEYFIPGHQDTAVVIEKITIWNESGGDLSGFLVGEGLDWDMDRDSNLDAGGIDFARSMVYQRGKGDDDSTVAGLMPYGGYDASVGAAVLDNSDWIYPDTGYNTVDIYNYLTALDGSFNIFSDSLTDLNSVYRFREGTLATDDTIEICKIKAVSLDGVTGLQELMDKGVAFIENYDLCAVYEPPQCAGICGDANEDGGVNVSDAVWIINFVFVTGSPEPKPVLACGDANTDGGVNVSDAVWIINFVFVTGSPAPGTCSPGAPAWGGQDCCEYTP